MFKDQMQQDVIMVLKFPSNSPVTHVAANTLPHLSIPAAVTVTCSRLFAVNRWHNTVGEWVVESRMESFIPPSYHSALHLTSPDCAVLFQALCLFF